MTINSGATTEFDKADVESGSFLIECKTTNKKSFSLKKALFDKVNKEAIFKNKIPLMEIEIGHDKYIVSKEDDFFAMLQEEYLK